MSVITKDLGVATAYGYAKFKGYTGTEEEFAELMASYADVAQQAEAAAQDAEDAKDEAVTAKTDAQTAKTAAQAAQSAAETASGAASTKASEAAQSAQAASGSATAAQTSATAAAGSAQTAQAAAQTATTKASEASSSASAASTAKTGAETARTGAQTAQAAAETAQENAEAAAASVSASAAQIEQNTEDIAELKNDLNEKADKTEALSAYIVETETGSIASFTDGADDVPVKDLTVAIEPVQSGSGDPSPSNVRPISGWTGANVTACGVNVWDEEWELGTYNINTGAKEGSNANIRCKNLIPVIPNTAYYLLAPEAHWLIEYDANKNAIKYGAVESQVYTVSGDTHYLAFYMNGTYGTTYNHDISINYPSTDTAYHAYNGSSVSVDWTTEAGTVYGGTLDVTTGVLTVDRASVDLGTLTGWGYNQANLGAFGTEVLQSLVANNNCICSSYKTLSAPIGSTIENGDMFVAINKQDDGTKYTGNFGIGTLIVKDTNYTDVNSFVSAMSGIQFVYELSTPQTYQLTPQEVSTILGQNNIFADTGDVTVQYRADTKLYIDKVVSA